MRVAISQPEHFPYLGFFQKMARADLFVLLDDVQFAGRRSFQSRNRLTDRSGASDWFTVPVAKGSYKRRLDQVVVSPDTGWRLRLRRKLRYFFGHDFAAVYQPDLLCEINIRSIHMVRAALGINVPMVRSSTLGCTGAKSERLSRICRAVGADTYLCGSGGASYLEPEAFGKIKVEFFREAVPDYRSSVCHLSLRQIGFGLASLRTHIRGGFSS
jgi:hypothetical protein